MHWVAPVDGNDVGVGLGNPPIRTEEQCVRRTIIASEIQNMAKGINTFERVASFKVALSAA
jgi:hypothetical protein